MVIPFVSSSQNDITSYSYIAQFKNNLAELSNLYCWSDTGFYAGKFEINSIQNIQAEFEKLNLTVFTKFHKQTNTFYEFLDELEIAEKQNLIRYFSFFENEFETVLKNEGLPIELKYLAPALSAMNTKAISFDGKSGVWQLIHFQAVLNGIQISKLVDERFNISRSTIAAAKQIAQNLNQFEDINLAVSAFVFGNVKVRNAIALAEKSGGEINEFMPESFNEIISAFQATSIFFNINKFKNIDDSIAVKSLPDTVIISRQLHFKQVTEVLKIPVKQLQFLNPQFKFSVIPGNIKPVNLTLPDGKFDDFVLWQDSIYNS